MDALGLETLKDLRFSYLAMTRSVLGGCRAIARLGQSTQRTVSNPTRGHLGSKTERYTVVTGCILNTLSSPLQHNAIGPAFRWPTALFARVRLNPPCLAEFAHGEPRLTHVGLADPITGLSAMDRYHAEVKEWIDEGYSFIEESDRIFEAAKRRLSLWKYKVAAVFNHA